MPNRIIRHNICDSERLHSISAEAERLYVRLMVNADDYGRFEATPLVVGTACFPRMFQSDDEKSIIQICRKVKAWLDELATAILIAFYVHQGRRYLVFYNWSQRLDRMKERYPKPPDNVWVADGKPSGNQVETIGNAESESESESETEMPAAVSMSEVGEVYEAYPRKIGKPFALKAIRRAIAEFGFDLILNKTKLYATTYNGDPQFIPYPQKWFNQQRFNDDPSTWKSNEANQRNNPIRTDRNKNTANDGKASQYRGVGRVGEVPDVQRPTP